MKKRKRKIRRGIADAYLGRIVALCLVAGMLINIFLPDKASSEIENRELTQFPKLTADTLADGSFTDDFESYEADQFAGRNFFRNAQIFLRWLGGDREENDVYLGKDGQLLEKIVSPTEKLLSEDAQAINEFAQAYGDVRISMMLVPDAGTILSDSYPAYAQENDQKAYYQDFQSRLSDSINKIDLCSVLEGHEGEKLYYKTDHHWTSLGAKYGYEAYCSQLSLTAGDFTAYTVSDDFNGSLSSTSGFCQGETETIEIYTPDAGTKQIVNYVDNQSKKSTLYDMDKLETKDQYAVFMGGNYSLIDIKTTTDNEQTLLLFKDSFANSLIPFLVTQYKEIVVVDPRYYYGTVTELMSSYSINDVLFLYSGNTLFADNNLKEVLSLSE